MIGRRLGLPVERVADATFGPFGPTFATDQPTHPSLLADLECVER